MASRTDDNPAAAPETLLITGSGGGVGSILRPRLQGAGRLLRLLDLVPPEPPARPGEETLLGSVTDRVLLREAMQGVDAVVHLGGLSSENDWASTLQVNIDGTQAVLDAAQRAGVRRVILASSNHAVGFREVGASRPDGIPADSTPRPDTFYGVSKVAMEGLGSLYHSRFGMDVIAIRIGSCFPDPTHLGERGLATWLSPDDAGRLFEACLTAPSPGFRLVWGVSANTRGIFSLSEAEQLGYRPKDDAERFAAQLAGEPPTADDSTRYVGGAFCTAPLGVAESG